MGEWVDDRPLWAWTLTSIPLIGMVLILHAPEDSDPSRLWTKLVLWGIVLPTLTVAARQRRKARSTRLTQPPTED